MALEPTITPQVMQAVEALGYRVTVGDVAAQAGLRVALAEQGLLALASAVGGHLQVAESGDIAYVFPQNFRSVLFSQYWQLRFKRGLAKVWNILFYLIRIGFGVALMASIGILAIALVIAAFAAMAAASNDDNDSNSGSLDGLFRGLGDLLGGTLRLFYYTNWMGSGAYGTGYEARSESRSESRAETGRGDREKRPKSELNFLEAVFSFLFGDGNPNADLDERRWQAIAQVIRSNGGAIAAEQVLPFLSADGRANGTSNTLDADDAILPVLTRFQGQPQVSPAGELVYQFPDLQVSAGARDRSEGNAANARPPSRFLQERPWQFSKATSGQLWAAGLLGVLNAGLAVAVGLILPDLATAGIGFMTFVSQIYPLLLAYGLGFLLIPLIRWQVVKGRDRGVQQRNQQRQALSQTLSAPELQTKLAYAQQFSMHQQLKPEDAQYTTETDLIDQEIDQQDQLDAEWQRRLSS